TGGIEPLADLFGVIEKAYLIGEAENAFAATLEGHAAYVKCGDMEHAVQAAFADAKASGEDAIVLLSPACASFDQFADLEAPGQASRAAVPPRAEAPARGEGRTRSSVGGAVR